MAFHSQLHAPFVINGFQGVALVRTFAQPHTFPHGIKWRLPVAAIVCGGLGLPKQHVGIAYHAHVETCRIFHRRPLTLGQRAFTTAITHSRCIGIVHRVVVGVNGFFVFGSLPQHVAMLNDGPFATWVARFKLIVKVLCGLVETPSAVAVVARALVNLNHTPLVFVAPLRHVEVFKLNIKHRLHAVVGGNGKEVAVIGLQTIIARGHNLLGQGLGLLPFLLPNVAFGKEGGSRTPRGAPQILCGLVLLMGQFLHGGLEIGLHKGPAVLHRCPSALVFGGFQQMVYQRNSPENLHQAKVVIPSHKACLGYETALSGLADVGIALNACDNSVGAVYSFVLLLPRR